MGKTLKFLQNLENIRKKTHKKLDPQPLVLLKYYVICLMIRVVSFYVLNLRAVIFIVIFNFYFTVVKTLSMQSTLLTSS